MRPFSGLLAMSIGLGLSAPVASASSTQVWLTEGEVFLTLENGEEVTLTAGNYMACDERPDTDTDDSCEILPLAIAPIAPAAIIGGLASAPLAVAPATIIGTVVAPAVGAAAVAAGVALGITSTNQTNVTTTPSTNN